MSSQTETSKTPQEAAGGCFVRIVRLLFLLFLGVLGAYLLLLPGGHPRSIGRAHQCRNNLKQITLALLNYHDVYKCFPPACIADADGRSMHSWRVLILPYLEQAERYRQYRFDEPWDGPNNSQLAGRIPEAYRCPSEPNQNFNDTNYLLITGDGTAWADGRAPAVADFTDGMSNTIVLVEVANSGIHWMEPGDMSFEQAMRDQLGFGHVHFRVAPRTAWS